MKPVRYPCITDFSVMFLDTHCTDNHNKYIIVLQNHQVKQFFHSVKKMLPEEEN